MHDYKHVRFQLEIIIWEMPELNNQPPPPPPPPLRTVKDFQLAIVINQRA